MSIKTLHITNSYHPASGGIRTFEWSVPYEQTVFHLGVHNLPGARAHAWMEELARFTANPRPERLRQLLHELNAEPSVLLILNHP